MTVHSELTLATPLHSLHIGTEQYAHTQDIALHIGTACPFP